MSRPVQYSECFWGDSITGTKEQLQCLGLGVGRAFPGEPGGPARRLNLRDHRGFPVTIERRGDNEYWASVRFTNWPQAPEVSTRTRLPSGLLLRQSPTYDEFIGRPEALVADGLVRMDQLPGMPGMGKACVTILPDGTVATRANKLSRAPAARYIQRASRSTFSVTVRITEEERTQRYAARRAAKLAFELHIRSLPRPSRLQPLPAVQRIRLEAAQSQAAHDMAFQGMLARIVAGVQRPAA